MVIVFGLFFLLPQPKHPPTMVHGILRATVDEFIADAIKHGIDIEHIRKELDYIVPMPLDANLYGAYTPYNRQISINFVTCKNPYILKATIYHELGHVYGLGHEEGGIMRTHQSPVQITNKYMNTETWFIHKEILFNRIKNKQ